MNYFGPKTANSITYTKKQLALYLTTQSNVIAAIEKGDSTYAETDHWLERELSIFFDGEDVNENANLRQLDQVHSTRPVKMIDHTDETIS